MARLLLLLTLCLLVAWPLPGIARPNGHPRAGGWLGLALQAWQVGDRAALQHVADNGQAEIEGTLSDGRWRLQLHVIKGLDADSIDARTIASVGGTIAVRGIDVLDVWLPLRQVGALLDAMPAIAFAQLPWRPTLLTGPKTSEGSVQLRAGPQFACLAAEASGVTVAVLDSGFDGLDKSVESGEVPHLKGKLLKGGGSHGTMCSEVVADMAPKADIYPYAANSFAELQLFVKQITSKGNPNAIAVVSHSVIWLGMSFGRHEGKLCELTDLVREAGVAWVSASGNSGSGEFYKGVWADFDNDQKHEFSLSNELLQFNQGGGGQIQMTLDWDDYTDRNVNLDLYLSHLEDGKWVAVTESKNKAGPFVAPIEQILVPNAKGGVYGLEVVAVGKVPKGMKLRIVSMGSGTGPLSVWHKNGNVYDPASCNGVLTVGGIYQGQYATGPLEGYSSYGPTPDKRIKPEVMAPTGVSTSFGAFFGTSAACPHAAGALATWIAATGQAPLVAAENLRKAAIPMGETTPDEAYGWGRIALPAVDLGWQCTAADLPAGATCVTACNSVGTHSCGPACHFTACAPPGESCTQKDDNCDGATDEGLVGCVAPAAADAGSGAEQVADTATAEPDSDALAIAVDAAATDAAKAAAPATPKPTSGCQTATGGRPQNLGWLGALLALAAVRGRRSRDDTGKRQP